MIDTSQIWRDAHMGRKSVKEDKNIYFTLREDLGLSREQASEQLGCISVSRLSKIEYGEVIPYPEEISPLMMTIRNQEDEINRKDREIAHLQKTLELLKGNSKEKTSRTKTKKTPSKS